MRCIVVDIDGVLSDASARFATLFVDGEPDWERFHDERMDEDPQLPWCEVLKVIAETSVYIVLMTNRLEEYRERTEKWLENAGINYDLLLMRREEDSYADNKGDQLDWLMVHNYEPVFGVDDDPYHKDVYNTRGIPLVYVHSGYNNGEIIPERQA